MRQLFLIVAKAGVVLLSYETRLFFSGILAGFGAKAFTDGKQPRRGLRKYVRKWMPEDWATGSQVGQFKVAVSDGAHIPARVGMYWTGKLALDLFPPVELISDPDVIRGGH